MTLKKLILVISLAFATSMWLHMKYHQDARERLADERDWKRFMAETEPLLLDPRPEATQKIRDAAIRYERKRIERRLAR